MMLVLLTTPVNDFRISEEHGIFAGLGVSTLRRRDGQRMLSSRLNRAQTRSRWADERDMKDPFIRRQSYTVDSECSEI